MLTFRIRIILLVILLVFIAILYFIVRGRKLSVKHSLPWLFMGIALLLVDCIPGILDYAAHLMGVVTPANLIFVLGFIFLILIVLGQAMSISKMPTQIRRLTQEMALMENQQQQGSNIKDREMRM